MLPKILPLKVILKTLYRIILVYLTSNTTRKHLQVTGRRILKHRLNPTLGVTASLPDHRHKARGQMKPPFYAIITNLPVGCSFWGSNEFVSSAPCLSSYLQSGLMSSFCCNETISKH